MLYKSERNFGIKFINFRFSCWNVIEYIQRNEFTFSIHFDLVIFQLKNVSRIHWTYLKSLRKNCLQVTAALWAKNTGQVTFKSNNVYLWANPKEMTVGKNVEALKVAPLVARCKRHTQNWSFFSPFLFIPINFNMWNHFEMVLGWSEHYLIIKNAKNTYWGSFRLQNKMSINTPITSKLF